MLLLACLLLLLPCLQLPTRCSNSKSSAGTSGKTRVGIGSLAFPLVSTGRQAGSGSGERGIGGPFFLTSYWRMEERGINRRHMGPVGTLFFFGSEGEDRGGWSGMICMVL